MGRMTIYCRVDLSTNIIGKYLFLVDKCPKEIPLGATLLKEKTL